MPFPTCYVLDLWVYMQNSGNVSVLQVMLLNQLLSLVTPMCRAKTRGTAQKENSPIEGYARVSLLDCP